MNVKVFQTNANGKIEFSRNDLEKLLNEVYNDGYNAGEKHMRETYWTWSPSNLADTISTTSLPITYTIETSTSTSTKPIDNLNTTKLATTDKIFTSNYSNVFNALEKELKNL